MLMQADGAALLRESGLPFLAIDASGRAWRQDGPPTGA
jgi:hypothetical protein